MSPKEFSKRIGKSVVALQRCDNSGKLAAHRTPKNRRFYTEDLTNIVHVFSCLSDGLRKYKKGLEDDKNTTS